MELHLRVATIFAKRWSTHETRDFSQRRFEDFSSLLLNELPGYYGLGLISPDRSTSWVIPKGLVLDNNFLGPKWSQVIDEAQTSSAVHISAPFHPTADTARIFAVLPLFRGSEFLGYLIPIFNLNKLIDGCFHSRIRSEFHLAVQDGTEIIFQSSPWATAEKFSQASVLASSSLLVRNRIWQVVMMPKQEKAQAYGWTATLPLPLFGFLMSIGISGLVFLLLKRMQMYRMARDLQSCLSRKILVAQEQERLRISRDLHDELGQMLMALRLELGWIEKRFSSINKDNMPILGNAVSLVNQATAQLKRMCRGLRPSVLDDLGIGPATKLLVDEFQGLLGKDVSIRLEFDIDEDKIVLSKDIGLCAYRIVQESLTNVSRHAQAKDVMIRLFAMNEFVFLQVIDDGKGFDPNRMEDLKGCGLEGMKERAHLAGGELEILSTPGKGTSVFLRLPLGKCNGSNHDSDTGGR